MDEPADHALADTANDARPRRSPAVWVERSKRSSRGTARWSALGDPVDELLAGPQVELDSDLVDEVIDQGGIEPHLLGYLVVAEALGHQLEHFRFAWCERM